MSTMLFPVEMSGIPFGKTTFTIQVSGNTVRILDTQYAAAALKGDPELEASRYQNDFEVTMYDERYPTFESWIAARHTYLKVSLMDDPHEDRQIIGLYDNGPYKEIKNSEGEVIAEDGGNLGYFFNLSVPYFSEWDHINAPLYGESMEEYSARQMEAWNSRLDILGPDGFIVNADENPITTDRAGDLPRFTDEQIAAAREAGEPVGMVDRPDAR